MRDELDRFRVAWAERRDGADALTAGEEQSMREVVDGIRGLDRRRSRQSVREIVIAGAAAVVFGASTRWLEPPWLAAWATVLAVAAVAIGGWKLWLRRRRGERRWSDDVRAFCTAELDRVEREIRLQRSLAWWYLAPIWLGVLLYLASVSDAPVAELAIVLPLATAAIGGVWLATRRSLDRVLRPRRAELTRCLEELGTE